MKNGYEYHFWVLIAVDISSVRFEMVKYGICKPVDKLLTKRLTNSLQNS